MATSVVVRVMQGEGNIHSTQTHWQMFLVVRRVLVDIGANEVIRPHSPDWWNEIMVTVGRGATCGTEVGRW
eukprot:297736-Prorocentrum_lima.AAC.1